MEILKCGGTVVENQFNSLSVKDLKFLNLLKDSQSLRSLSRFSGLSLAQASRTLSNLESLFGQTILNRSASGISLTEEGFNLVQRSEAILKTLENLWQAPTRDTRRTTLNLGSRTFLNYVFSPVFAKLSYEFPKILLRALDMPPEDLKVAEHKNLIDIAIYMNKCDWTRRWQVIEIGMIPWALYARENHEVHLKQNISLEELCELQFVLPSYWMNGEVREGKDGFPVENLTRKVALEVQNANCAARVAACSNCVAFIPAIVAAEENSLKKVKTEASLFYQQPLYLAFCESTVTKVYLDALICELKKVLVKISEMG
jgi:DNA-binding transcriptional LysR family regulator